MQVIVTVDRFEGEFAVVELSDRSTVNLPIRLVPGAREGDVIKIEIDGSADRARKSRIDRLADKLWAD